MHEDEVKSTWVLSGLRRHEHEDLRNHINQRQGIALGHPGRNMAGNMQAGSRNNL